MFQAGVARTTLTPFWGVELTGWGYYIERRWQRVHDDLNATALAFDDGERQAIVVALDLMVIDEPFTRRTRERIGAETGLAPGSILLTCSHSHNAPAAGGLLGVGECDPAYEDWASRQAATAAILAWRQREPATARCGHATVDGDHLQPDPSRWAGRSPPDHAPDRRQGRLNPGHRGQLRRPPDRDHQAPAVGRESRRPRRGVRPPRDHVRPTGHVHPGGVRRRELPGRVHLSGAAAASRRCVSWRLPSTP